MTFGIDLQRSVFDLSAGAHGDVGWASGEAGARLRGNVRGSAELCHGLSLGLGGDASAGISLDGTLVGLFAASAGAAGQAEASAAIRAQVLLDGMDEAGVVVDAHAVARASVAAWIDVGLTFGALLDGVAAVAGPNSLVFDLVGLLLEEARVGGGVVARASAAAQARATASVMARLREGDGRLEATVEADAGWGVGAGVGVHLFADLEDPFRCYRRSVDRITAEVVGVAANVLPASVGPGLAAARLVVPIALEAAYVLGQAAIDASTTGTDEVDAPFLRAVGDRVVLWLVDRVAQAAVDALGPALLPAVLVRPARVRRLLADALRAVADGLDGARPDPRAALDALSTAIDALDAADVVLPAGARSALAVGWSSIAVGLALRGLLEDSGLHAEARFLGLSNGGATQVVLPPAPRVVREELAAVLGRSVRTRPGLDDALGHLGAVARTNLLVDHAPEVAAVLVDVADVLGVSPAEVAGSVLHVAVGGDVVDTALFGAVRMWLDRATDEVADLLEEAAASAPDPVREWVDGTVRPSLALLSDALLTQAAEVVMGRATAASLQEAAGFVVARVVLRQWVVLSDVAVEAARVAFVDGCHEVAGALEAAGTSHPLMSGIVTVLGSDLAVGAPTSTLAHRRRLVRLAAGLLRTAGDAFGPSVHTPARRRARRGHLEAILDAVDTHVADADAVEAAVQQLAECVLPVGVLEPLQGLVADELALFGDSAVIVAERVPPLLAEFYLDVASDVIAAADAALLAAVQLVAEAAEVLASAWDDLDTAADAVSASAAEFLADANANVDAISAALAIDAATLRVRTRRAVIELWLGVDDADTVDPADYPIELATFLVTFDLVPNGPWELLASAFGLLAEGLTALFTTIVAAGEGVESFRSEVDDQVRATLGMLTHVPLIFEAVRRALGLDAAEALVADALDYLRRHNDAAAAASRLAHAAEATRAEVVIVSPVPFTPDASTGAAPTPVALRVDLHGASLSAVTDATLSPVVVLLNGRRLAPPAAAWSTRGDGVRLALDLVAADGLVDGINALEVSLVTAGGSPVRELVTFLAATSRSATGIFELVRNRTTIDTPGSDHEQVEQERVCLRWRGDADVALRGWRLTDRYARHVFVFPDDLVLAPGQAVTVITGPGSRRGRTLRWGERQAVWNNRGDTVRLIDEMDVVRFLQDVKGEGR